MPLERFTHAALADPLPSGIRRRASHARFTLLGGADRFLAEVHGADSSGIEVSREGFRGHYRIPLDSIAVLEFNPYTSTQ